MGAPPTVGRSASSRVRFAPKKKKPNLACIRTNPTGREGGGDDLKDGPSRRHFFFTPRRREPNSPSVRPDSCMRSVPSASERGKVQLGWVKTLETAVATAGRTVRPPTGSS